MNGIIAWVVSLLIGITGVSLFIRKWFPVVHKDIHVAQDALGLLDEVVESFQDGKLTAEEIQGIILKVEQLKSDFFGGK